MKVKEFVGKIGTHELEDAINRFLENDEIELVDIRYTTSENGYGVDFSLALVIYKESKEPLCVRLEDLNNFEYEESN